jgi:hypothetical protein
MFQKHGCRSFGSAGFFLADVICIVEAFLAWEGYNFAIAAKHAFFTMTEYEPTCLHFFCAQN